MELRAEQTTGACPPLPATREELPTNTHRKITEQSRLSRMHRREPTEAKRIRLNRHGQGSKEVLRVHRNRKWDNRLRELNPEDQSIWQMQKAMRREGTVERECRENQHPEEDDQERSKTPVENCPAK